VLSNVTVMTPDLQRTLVTRISLTVRPGESLLIVGASGGGKSSLLRVIAGLWSTGEGHIERPLPGEMLFLSQRSYMVVGTLRDQLFYPRRNNPRIPDRHLQAVLEAVNLPDLAQRLGGFHEEVDWARTLSLGEQQRIAFARVLLTKPRFVMLDEATSALDVENEENLYRLLAQQGLTMISISHRTTTLKFHQLVLELAENGAWSLHKAEEYRFPGETEDSLVTGASSLGT
jgi:putative ATP-binding cassette transporter